MARSDTDERDFWLLSVLLLQVWVALMVLTLVGPQRIVGLASGASIVVGAMTVGYFLLSRLHRRGRED